MIISYSSSRKLNYKAPQIESLTHGFGIVCESSIGGQNEDLVEEPWEF